jgi:hypothetical protein
VIVSASSEGDLCVWNPDGKLLSEIQFGADINDPCFWARVRYLLFRTPSIGYMRFHEKAVKLLLKFISHYSRGGGIVLSSGLGMLVHALIPSLPQRVERCHPVIEVSY